LPAGRATLVRMARIPRSVLVGHCYHVINRGNRRATVFHDARDYDAFMNILAATAARFDVGIIAACIMPNHFHFVLRPMAKGELSRWLHWVLTTQVARYRRVHGTEGRIWQGRSKTFPIQHDAHLLAVMRYTERNALRAGLVTRAEYWPWGSLRWRGAQRSPVELMESPKALPPDWNRWVNEAQTSAELEALRRSVNRQLPFGDAEWIKQIQGDTAD
jgi:putative transposase